MRERKNGKKRRQSRSKLEIFIFFLKESINMCLSFVAGVHIFIPENLMGKQDCRRIGDDVYTGK